MNPRWLAHGKRCLEAPPEPLKKSACLYLRIYYRSEGGELLCTDAGPMTLQASGKLENSLLSSAAVDALRHFGKGPVFATTLEAQGLLPYEGMWWGHKRRTAEHYQGLEAARLVIFPSQDATQQEKREAA